MGVEISKEVTLVPQGRVCLTHLSFNQPSSQLCLSNRKMYFSPREVQLFLLLALCSLLAWQRNESGARLGAGYMETSFPGQTGR